MQWIRIVTFLIANASGGFACFAFGGLGCGLGGLGGLLGGGGGGCCTPLYTGYAYGYAPRRCCGGYGGGGCCGRTGYGYYGSYGSYGGYGGYGGGCCDGDTCRRRLRHRMRAFAAKTLRLSDFKRAKSPRRSGKEPKLDQVHTPDRLFGDCCRNFNVTPSCQHYCNYRSYSIDTLQNVFLGGSHSPLAPKCQLESLSALHFCASGNRDHRRCCRSVGVSNTMAGAKCLLFCQPMTDKSVNLDLSYLPCLEKTTAMRKCFYEGALEVSRHLARWPEKEF